MTPTDTSERRDGTLPDRPSRHGKMLGERLAALAIAGRKHNADAPDLCATCAFRSGSVPNQCAGTVKMALDIVLGIDKDNFACHHGMKEGQPTKYCVGAILAAAVPFAVIKDEMKSLHSEMDTISGPDQIRHHFDLWWDRVDPEHKMDVYELASAYARDGMTPIPHGGKG